MQPFPSGFAGDGDGVRAVDERAVLGQAGRSVHFVAIASSTNLLARRPLYPLGIRWGGLGVNQGMRSPLE